MSSFANTCADQINGCEVPNSEFIYLMVAGAMVMCAWGIVTFVTIGLHIEQTENIEQYDGIEGAPSHNACFKGSAAMEQWIRTDYFAARKEAYLAN